MPHRQAIRERLDLENLDRIDRKIKDSRSESLNFKVSREQALRLLFNQVEAEERPKVGEELPDLYCFREKVGVNYWPWVQFLEYRQNGLLHRLNGPATAEYFRYLNTDNNRQFRPQLAARSWRQNGRLHCLTGPALVYFYAENKSNQRFKLYEEYWQNGRPAPINPADKFSFARLFFAQFDDQGRQIEVFPDDPSHPELLAKVGHYLAGHPDRAWPELLT